jgi:hypothetical protein
MEVEHGHKFSHNESGEYIAPIALRQLISMAAGALYNHQNPAHPKFTYIDGEPENMQVTFDGDPNTAGYILGIVGTYSQGFLSACEQQAPLKVVSEKYWDAVDDIRALSR